MELRLTKRNALICLFLGAFWALVVIWQIQEHIRVRESAKNNLRNRSKDIANTVGSVIRGLNFRGAVFSDRLQPVLEDLVIGHTNELVVSAEVTSITLLNTSGDRVAWAGNSIDLNQQDLLQEGEHWGRRSMLVVYPIEGANVTQEGTVKPPPAFLLEPPTNSSREGGRPFRQPERGPDGPPPPSPPDPGHNSPPPSEHPTRADGEGRPRDGEFRPRRPPWLRGMSDSDFQALTKKKELHGLALALSTINFQAVCRHDLWLRCVIIFFATVSVVGSGVSWHNIVTSSDLQLRLMRASEMNSHLREMNLAAAGLAHETRNPLNIIRGRAQMISKLPDATSETQQRAREIIDEADKVAAQLNEFINYSRPREVRPAKLALASVVNEVVRALSYDLEEKKINLLVRGDQLAVQADEQLLRQALFNLLLNAIQAVEPNGEIQVVASRRSAVEGVFEVRDNGPGVPPENRAEIFKPYFTTQKTGTGLGLAVVHQIVLAHGWEIECLPNDPKGAILRVSHLKLAT